MRSATRVGSIVCLLLTVSTVVAQEDRYTIAEVHEQFIELSNAVMDNALKPPTRQAMLLEGLRKSGMDSPDLARRVSDARAADEVRELLSEAFDGKDLNDKQRQAFLSACLHSTDATLVSLEGLQVPRQLRDNLYVGIGIQLTMKNGVPSMPVVFPRGPARKAKARNHDKILEVDGVPTRGKNLGEVVQMLRGPRGTEVKVVVQTGSDEPRELLMTRDVVPIDSVEGVRRRDDDSWDFALPDNKRIAFLRIRELKGSTVAEVRDAARRIERGDFRGLVLDLTAVNDGEFRHAVMLADLFIRGGFMGHSIERSGARKYEADEDGILADHPLVVIVGAGTRGPAEWFAAALKDRKRAKLVGARTAGYGAIRKELDLKSGFALTVRSGEMIRSNGKPIQIPDGAVRRRLQQHNGLTGMFSRITGAPAKMQAELADRYYQSSHVGGVFPDVLVNSTPGNQISAALQTLQPHLEDSLLKQNTEPETP